MKIIALSSAFSIFYLQAVSAADACMPTFVPAGGNYQFLHENTPDYNITGTARVGDVYYTRLPIFDEANPDENLALFRWANRIHVLTQESTISQQVLFESGQEFDPRLLQESSRLLRSQGYFYDVDIRPVSLCSDEVDIEVITQDNWSFTPSVSFSRSGGENSYNVGIRDSNMFGRGKALEVAHDSDTDRRSNKVLYQDNNVLGTRIRNLTSLSDSDDGSRQLFELKLPFFSLDSRRAWAIQLDNDTRIDQQYYRGDDVSEVEHDVDDFAIEYGFSQGLQNGSVRRWTTGYRYRKDSFGLSDELPPPTVFPTDKELSFPFLGYESLEDNFATAFNLDQIYRTEDLHLGQRLGGSLGYAAEGFGSDQDRVVFEGFYSDTLFANDDMLWQHSLELEGMWNLESSEAEDLLLSYETRYFRRITSHRSFFASLEVIYSKNLNTNKQVVLGGFSGARAFDNRFQVGDRSVILALEERIYTDIHLWNLVRVGAAVFIDVGRAWEPGVDSGMEDKVLADIGFGLRLASSKAASGRIAHIDFAFPLTNRNDPDVDDFQIAFTIKGRF